MMEQSSDMRYLHDLGGNIIELNNEACKATGYTKKVIEKMNVFDLYVAPSRKEEILKAWQSGGITLSVTPAYGWIVSEKALR